MAVACSPSQDELVAEVGFERTAQGYEPSILPIGRPRYTVFLYSLIRKDFGDPYRFRSGLSS
jgi:hypothetical protein